VVIGLELLNLFNCKYNLLWLQKSLTSDNPSWCNSYPSYAQSLGNLPDSTAFCHLLFWTNSVSECL